MKDWQKILELLSYQCQEKEARWNNPMIKTATEYLYNVLKCLIKDVETKIIPIPENQAKVFDKIYNMNYLERTEVKAHILGVSDIEWKMKLIANGSDLFYSQEIEDYINSAFFYKRHKIKKIDLKMLHQLICKDMFQKMSSSYKYGIFLWVSMELDREENAMETWSDYVSQEGERGIKLEIVSKEILEYDGYVFDALLDDPSAIRETIKEIYRPYLVEYYIDTKELGEAQRAFLQQMYQKKGWYKVALADDTTNIDVDKYITFEGVFVHSASPVEYEDRKLVIIDGCIDIDASNNIEETYDMDVVECASDADIQDELIKLFDGVSFHRTRVYKVGNGNCIYNYGKKGNREKRFFYDIGFGMKVHIGADPNVMERNYRAALKNIRGSRPHCIILSHWDTDHFRGYVCAKKKFFGVRWIAPNIYNSEDKANAKRLLLYLYRIGRVMVVERVPEREIVIQHANKSRMTLYIGKNGGANNGITKHNCEGIAIRLENDTIRYGKIRCLMQGDVPYTCLPPQAHFAMENPYEYLVVPHHGAKMNYSLLLSGTKKDGQAVISCTNDMSENRPERDHLDKLKKCYNNVKSTEQAKCYIQLELQRKNHMILY